MDQKINDKENQKIFKMNENENTTAKAVLRGNFVSINTFLKK